MPPEPSLFDSHCHLTSERLREEVDAVLARARDAGVTRVVTIASDVEDAGHARELARTRPGLWSTAGVHPHQAGEAAADAAERVRELAGHPEVVAVGETLGPVLPAVTCPGGSGGKPTHAPAATSSSRAAVVPSERMPESTAGGGAGIDHPRGAAGPCSIIRRNSA